MQPLSHTAGYAILALAFVAGRKAQWVQAKEIAKQTGLPRPYLSKILHLLGKAGLVRTKRGYRGGIALMRPAAEVTLLEVAAAVGPLELGPTCVMGFRVCDEKHACPMHAFWQGVRKQLEEQLSAITLAQLATQQGARSFALPNAQTVQQFFRASDVRPARSARPPRAYQPTKPTGRFLRKFQ